MKAAYRTWLYLSMSAFATSPAFAQTSPASPGAPAPASDERVTNDEIVVTATRENTLLSKTPLAVTAVTGDTLTKAGVTNPTQLGELAPNLSIDRQNGLQVTIRGVTSADNSEKGDPSAGFMVDNVFIARAQAQEVSFFDLDRIEVLRGPQGTLYGRNTTAGLVSLITARPRLGEFSGKLDASYGNYDAVQATGVLNIPLGSTMALRAAVNYDRRDNYINRGTSPFKIDPAKKNLSGRASLLFQPSDRLTVVIKGDYSSIKGRPSSVGGLIQISNLYQAPFLVPVSGQLGADPLVLNVSNDSKLLLRYAERQQPAADNWTWGIQGDVSYELSDDLTATYIGSYREFKRDEQFTGLSGVLRANGAAVTSLQTFDGKYRQNSQELRFAYADDAFKLQVGGYYFKEKSDIAFLLFGTQGFQPGQRGYIFGFPQNTNSESYALFGQGTINVSDAFRVTGGVRWTHDEKTRVGATIFHANLTDPLDFTTATQPGTTNPRNVTDSLNNASVKYSKVTWRAGLEWDASPTTLLYATVSTGYKAGGFNDGCLAGTTNCAGNAVTAPNILFYEPETLTSYELGAKARFLDGALRLNLNAFHYDYTNLQLSQLTLVAGSPAQRTLNAGKAKVDGVELEAIVRPASNHQFDFSAAWLNARYTDYAIQTTPAVVQFAGKKLDRSPEWVVSAGYTWTIPLGNGGDFQLGARTRLSDTYYLTAPALRAQFRQPSFTKTDLSITYNAPDQRFYVQGFVRNLENELTLSSASVTANFGAAFDDGVAQLSDPRTYGIRAGVKF